MEWELPGAGGKYRELLLNGCTVSVYKMKSYTDGWWWWLHNIMNIFNTTELYIKNDKIIILSDDKSDVMTILPQ